MEWVFETHPTQPIPYWVGFFPLAAAVALAYFGPRLFHWALGRSRSQFEQQGLAGMTPFASCGGVLWLVVAVLALFVTGIVILSGHAMLIPARVSPRAFP